MAGVSILDPLLGHSGYFTPWEPLNQGSNQGQDPHLRPKSGVTSDQPPRLTHLRPPDNPDPDLLTPVITRIMTSQHGDITLIQGITGCEIPEYR